LRLQLLDALHASGTPSIIDAYVPNILEQGAARKDEEVSRDSILAMHRTRLELRAAVRIGTVFLCAGAAYRDFLLGVLGVEGRLGRQSLVHDADASQLVVSAPFGLSAEDVIEPEVGTGPLRQELGLEANDIIFLWAGGIWDWLDPLTPIHGLARAIEDGEDASDLSRAHLVFLGVDHPNPEVRTESLGRIQRLVSELGLGDRVHVRRGWVPYDDRGRWLADADVGVCAHFDSLETRYSWRQRLLDHVWAALPTICSAGDELGSDIATAGAGVQVDAKDVGAWATAIQDATDADWRSDRARNAVALREEMSWSKVAETVHASAEHAYSNPSADTRSPRSLLPSYVKVQVARMGLRRVAQKAVRSLTRH
jgi:glycosyltransferase involved in cell wall biosynthesis